MRSISRNKIVIKKSMIKEMEKKLENMKVTLENNQLKVEKADTVDKDKFSEGNTTKNTTAIIKITENMFSVS
jgi:hypothetical protein